MQIRSVLTLAAASAIVFVPAVTAQQPVRPAKPDSARRDTAYALPTLTVTRAPESLAKAPVAADVITRAAIRTAQATIGLDEALSNLPGVYVSNRYNFSVDQRISIRGAGSRSNFGVRGIKILLDGVPQTLPDGQSQLNNVEFGALDRIEVLKGASSSLYGNASGGVIDLHSETASDDPFVQRVRGEYGSFHSSKWQTFTSARSGPLSATLTLSRFATDASRQQSATESKLLTSSINYAISATDALTLRISAADAPHARNPGALTVAEYAANRDSAAANNINRGADKTVTQQQGSLQYRHDGANGDQYQVTVFGTLRSLQNPLATPPPAPVTATSGTYVTIDRQAGGVRGSGSWILSTSAWIPRVTAGVDVQRFRDNRKNFRSIRGVQQVNALLLDQTETVTEVGPFTQLSWTPSERLFIAAGGRYDRSTFAVADHLLTDGDASGSRTLASTSGNVGLSYGFNGLFTPYTNVSTAFDTPTTTELANQPNSTGGFNTLLNPQKTLSVEVGARGHVARTLEYTVAVFRSSVRDAIIQYQEVGGRAYYTNAGRTRNDGVELGLSVAPTRGLRLFGSYTYGNYVFRDYTVVTGATSVSYAGKRLAGTPHSFARFGLRSQPVQGLTVDIDHTLSSSLFADDANTQVVNGWGNGVTNARASWTGRYQALSFAPFIGVNNLWNRAYVGSVTVNGTFGRVLEPAPLRNIYIGAEIGYRVIRR